MAETEYLRHFDGKVTLKVQKNEKSFPKICKCQRKCVILHPQSTNDGAARVAKLA